MRRRSHFVITIAVLAALHAILLSAGFFAPYDPAEQNRDLPYAPPTRVHFRDAQGKWHLHPFVYGLRESQADAGSYEEDISQTFPINFFACGTSYKLFGILPTSLHFVEVATPGKLFLIGTDGFGRDQFSRLLYGGQISLFAGALAALLALLSGAVIGAIAGFYGKRLDDGLMRLAELFLAIPWLYLLLAVRAFLPLSVAPVTAFLIVVAVLGVVGWARPARLVRGIVASAKERRYVFAARGFGASNVYLLRKHVLPATYPVLLTQATLLIPQFILAEVTLSFLGLGIAEPVPSWGNMLAAVQQYSVLVSYWWMLLPAAALAVVFLAYFTVADALQKRIQSAAI